ncbi:MAG: chemotaxis protein [Gammaproteobacteria bacterium RBG_16_51_14]|nr:MAG: chemotaxis protein [Gammaproteobacteria bacterium RBG_16_51_14]
MDLNQALGKHAEWKVKFRKAILDKETMDVETIAKDNCCEFGKWLHGDAKSRFSHLAILSECIKKHAIFHTEAGKVAKSINAKKFAEATAMIESDTPYAVASNAVGVAIMTLKKESGL